jgi:hypothetical protein
MVGASVGYGSDHADSKHIKATHIDQSMTAPTRPIRTAIAKVWL